MVVRIFLIKVLKFLCGARSKNFFGVKMNEKGCQNVSERMWKFVWWSANRDQIFQVVRESEKVENRCYRSILLPISASLVLVYYHHCHCSRKFIVVD